jgi:hypothetical protein
MQPIDPRNFTDEQLVDRFATRVWQSHAGLRRERAIYIQDKNNLKAELLRRLQSRRERPKRLADSV